MEKINITKILRDCPKGMELDCTMYNDVVFDHFSVESSAYPIFIKVKKGDFTIPLTEYGQYIDIEDAKCIIFPKGKTTWEGFQRPFKDGDIVTWDDRGSLVACIYKKRKNTASFNHHIALYKGGLGIVVNGEIALPDNELSFATEEEKQQLFDAIKENGYKWNAETKTLEKLIEPKFKVGDKIRHKTTNKNDIYEISKVYDDSYGLVGFTWMIYMKYQDQYELVPDKFDITTLKHFDKVLVRTDNFTPCWTIDFYDGYRPNIGGSFTPFGVSGGKYFQQCIPYEGNEHLLGTSINCNDFYKTWEK